MASQERHDAGATASFCRLTGDVLAQNITRADLDECGDSEIERRCERSRETYGLQDVCAPVVDIRNTLVQPARNGREERHATLAELRAGQRLSKGPRRRRHLLAVERIVE